jgi:hypothetical protein
MDLEQIKELPNTVNNIHESVFRSYHILYKVLELIERGDSKETILEIVNYLIKKDFDLKL